MFNTMFGDSRDFDREFLKVKGVGQKIKAVGCV